MPAPPTEVPYRSPDEIIWLDRPIRTGDTAPVSGGDDSGKPIVIRTPLYEIYEIRFVMDPAGALHVQGRVKNLSTTRDYPNPTVYVGMYDKLGVQIRLLPVKLSGRPALLFRGETGEFDCSFSKFTTTVGAYRMYMNP
ncbi:MAG: hypothetical protein HY815_19015 [Candidatus Riflebacteria bacterium]|nr:hypothetical protein [Candidatus Riflebacteria bacterium]